VARARGIRSGRLIGRDLSEALGGRIPGDHSRQTTAEHFIERFGAGALGMPPAGARVLDLGCGGGDSVDLFRRFAPGCDWTGADIPDSPEALGRTRTDARFVSFDGRTLPFADASFDLVYCKQVLEHVRAPRALLAEVARVVRPGGAFAGSTSQLEPYHSFSVGNWTPYGLTVLLDELGLGVQELRPGVDAFTLLAWRALGSPAGFRRAWERDSPANRAIAALGRIRGADARTVNTAKLVFAGQFAFLALRR